MALPTLYIDTGGTTLGSGSTDTTNPTHSSTINSVTVSVSATTVTFSANLDLTAVPTDGSATIFINDATNANAKLFKITAVDDTLNTVTVSIAPTGSITTSTWGIGGQFVYDSLRFEGALFAGWTVILNNTPATKTTDFITQRGANSGNSTSGKIRIIGKAGARRVLAINGTTQCIEFIAGGDGWYFENLEFSQNGGSGNVVIGGGNAVYYNCKWSDGGGLGFDSGGGGEKIVACEFTNILGDAIQIEDGAAAAIFGCYIHDCSAKGIDSVNTNRPVVIMFNIIDTCADRGIHHSVALAAVNTLNLTIINNTIYGCGSSGLEIADQDVTTIVINNIFQDNGNSATEYNVEWVAGAAEYVGFHSNNCFSSAGAGGSSNFLNYTLNYFNSAGVTGDPLFTDAANADFSIGSSSPAKATGYPGVFLGGSTGYLDMGAVQRQETSSGGPVGQQSM